MRVASFVTQARELDRLLSAEKRLNASIDKLTEDLDSLKARVIRLENREDLVIVEARAAASAASSHVAMSALSDIARRVGRLEERSDPRRLE